MSLPSWLQNLARPNDIRTLRRSIPGYEVNRDRAAVVIDRGFKYYERYEKLRPWIFLTALIGMGSTGYLWYRRRRVFEAHPVYGGTFLASAAAAWVTRPRPAPKPAAEGGPSVPGYQPESKPHPFVAYLDTKAQEEKLKDPQFTDKTFKRLMETDAIDDTWEETPEYIKALFV
jgi:hypothetical protein